MIDLGFLLSQNYYSRGALNGKRDSEAVWTYFFGYADAFAKPEIMLNCLKFSVLFYFILFYPSKPVSLVLFIFLNIF